MNLQTQRDRLTDPFHQKVERSGLRVASWQRWNGPNVEACFITLDHDVKLTLHVEPLAVILTRNDLRQSLPGRDVNRMTEGGGVSYSGVVSVAGKVKAANKSVKRKVSRNPKRLTEDEADYRFSQKSIKSGRPIPLSKVLKELGHRVER